MKTVEFKLTLNREQQATIDRWLGVQKWVWNKGLSLIEEFVKFKSWDKRGKTWVDCCPVGWDYWFYKEGEDFKSVPYSKCAPDFREYRPCCPVREDYREQPIESPNHFGLIYWFAQKNHPDKPWFTEVPSKFAAGTLKSLADAWTQYKKGVRKHPKYKRKHDRIASLVNNNAKDIKIYGDRIRIPNLGLVKAKTLGKRWPLGIPISVLKICKRPSGYYLQLTGEVPVKKRVKPSDKACGLDVGLQYIYADDAGKVVKPPKYYRQQELKLKRLQRKFARQEKGSANQKKTAQQIAKLHEKIRLRRRNFNHKSSTYLVRTFGGIAVENIQIANLVRRPKPKKREDGNGYEKNNAKAKSGLNKSFADAGLGQLLTMIEQKATVADREFLRVNPAYTSQNCPACGHQEKKALSQRTHLCSECGYTAQRDVAAAINIREKANFSRIYRACALRSFTRNVKPVKDSSVGSVQQESGEELFSLKEVPNDVGTTFKSHNRKTRKRRTQSAQSDSVTQLSLDLWGSALAETS